MHGPYVDEIPELAANILSRESAAFVDVIHTNGGFEPCVVCTNCKYFSNILPLFLALFRCQFGQEPSSSWVTWTSTQMAALPSLAACLG